MKLAVRWEVGKNVTNGNGSHSHSITRPRIESFPVARDQTACAHTVLLVDDDPNLIRLMGTILRTSGMEPLTASDGFAGLDVAASHRVDAIVLDLRMPHLDGPGFYRELRARGNETPVLIASAYGAREAQDELGAQGSIEKPFDPEVLVAELERLMDNGQGA